MLAPPGDTFQNILSIFSSIPILSPKKIFQSKYFKIFLKCPSCSRQVQFQMFAPPGEHFWPFKGSLGWLLQTRCKLVKGPLTHFNSRGKKCFLECNLAWIWLHTVIWAIMCTQMAHSSHCWLAGRHTQLLSAYFQDYNARIYWCRSAANITADVDGQCCEKPPSFGHFTAHFMAIAGGKSALDQTIWTE